MSRNEELIAGEEEQIKLALSKFKKERFPKATWEIRPHEGRPGVSVYGQSGWMTQLEELGHTALNSYMQGLYDAVNTD